MPCVTIDVKTPKVSAFEKYAIDVEPIPPRQRSNRNVHHGYLNSLKDTLDTLREIVEEARSELPSDSNLDYACVYTKRSQELLANASASCPKAVNKRDKFIATTPVTKKKRVTFADPLETSGNNTPKHVKQQSVQPTNVPILPSTGVNTATIASGSKPRSNTKKDKTLPAKSVPKKKVEDHPRNNKSKLSKKNRVDSCTSVRSTVCDTNSILLCKTCNECINSDSHDKCVDKSLKFSEPTPVRKIWRVKQVKQTWQPTGKLFTTVGHHWKPTGRTFPLGAQCPLTRKTTPKVVPVKIWKPTGRIIPLRGQCPLTRPTALTSDVVLADPQAHHAPVDYNIVCSNQLDPNIDWGSNVSNSPFSSVFKCRSYNSSFDTMTDIDVNAPAELAPTMAPPTSTDDQIPPHIRWVPIGKSNCYLDVNRPQSNPIFKIAVDLLKHTNFFLAFTASSAIPAIYIQQFCDTIRYYKITGGYKCQLDKQWFDLSKDTLRDALRITQIDKNNAFSSPPTPDALIKFVNDLGYPKVVRHLSDVVTNNMFQPRRELTTIIKLCLTGKTSGFERPRALVLQILWGVINRAHIDYAERM
ncbi:hypothetical protein Tco_0774470 [Tanacetum coccineum]|uniref:Uncharacterized protein n=1 Tax=Tanacetum coccineum TaxID=301880 RepID=A0ABQ4ZNK4_9ASTR